MLLPDSIERDEAGLVATVRTLVVLVPRLTSIPIVDPHKALCRKD